MSDENNIIRFPTIARITTTRMMRQIAIRHYKLVNREPVECGFIECAMWMFANEDHRRVDYTVVKQVEISTIFLGVDHRFAGRGPPLLFETMIFGGEHDEYQTRCSTWDEAERMHAVAVEMVRGLKVVK